MSLTEARAHLDALLDQRAAYAAVVREATPTADMGQVAAALAGIVVVDAAIGRAWRAVAEADRAALRGNGSR